MKMDEFLRKHDIDVGKTSGVLLFAWAIVETYDMLFALLYPNRVFINFNILIFLALASGMYRHSNTARRWCVALTWVIGLTIVAITAAAPFISSDRFTFAGREFSDPPFWKLVLTDLALLPAFWVVIRALTSSKAKEEFEAAAETHAEAISAAVLNEATEAPDA